MIIPLQRSPHNYSSYEGPGVKPIRLNPRLKNLYPRPISSLLLLLLLLLLLRLLPLLLAPPPTTTNYWRRPGFAVAASRLPNCGSCRKGRGSGSLSVTAAEVAEPHLP